MLASVGARTALKRTDMQLCESTLPREAGKPGGEAYPGARAWDQILLAKQPGATSSRAACVLPRARRRSSPNEDHPVTFEQAGCAALAAQVAVAEQRPEAVGDEDFSFTDRNWAVRTFKRKEDSEMFIDVSLPPNPSTGQSAMIRQFRSNQHSGS